MTEKNKRRSRVLIDRPVQLALGRRIALHWILLLVITSLALPLCRVFIQGDWSISFTAQLHKFATDAAILAIVFVCLVPYFVVDTIRLSNRFAGPMYRMRESIRSIVNGEEIRPLSFREGDFWQGVACEFNLMVSRLSSDQSEGSPPSTRTMEMEEANV